MTGEDYLKLLILEKVIAKCDRCSYYKIRDKTVPGEYYIDSKILFIAEAPGETENRIGKPLWGKSGQYFRKFVKDAKIIRPAILNIGKCWPGPGNPDPSNECINKCTHLLSVQIDLIKPQLIVAVGKISLAWLLNMDKKDLTPLSGYIGNTITNTRFNCPILPIYHPRYIMSSGRGKDYWKSFKTIINFTDKMQEAAT